MEFQRENEKPIQNPSENRIRKELGYVKGSYACLTDEDGNFIQVAGWQSGACMERRDKKTNQHFRAYQKNSVVPWSDTTDLTCSCGPVKLEPNEYFKMKQVADSFICFLTRQPFPDEVYWRDVTKEIIG